MTPLEVEQWLASIAGVRATVSKRVDTAVRAYCNQRRYAYAGRAKDGQSAAEKLETGRVESLKNFDDLFGCSIIIPNLEHEGEVIAELDKMFERVSLRQRHSTWKEPDVFRFEATRFIGRLRLPADDNELLATLLFEVQIRTAFEHAWSAATHDPAYKSDTVDWRLERLAAQMKALVEQLDMLAIKYHQSAAGISANRCDRTENESRILEWFLSLHRDGWIPKECEPESWGRFAQNVLGLVKVADWGSRLSPEEGVDRVNKAVSAELEKSSKGSFPRTLSLFQYVFGTVIQNSVIGVSFRRSNYFPPITSELEARFPRTREVRQRCDMSIYQAAP